MTSMTCERFVGRIAHYVSYGTPGGEYPSVCRAAVISAESPEFEKVDLVVLNPEGLFFNKGVPRSDAHKGGTWHWPVHTD